MQVFCIKRHFAAVWPFEPEAKRKGRWVDITEH
jgi:hypothetical protein